MKKMIIYNGTHGPLLAGRQLIRPGDCKNFFEAPIYFKITLKTSLGACVIESKFGFRTVTSLKGKLTLELASHLDGNGKPCIVVK